MVMVNGDLEPLLPWFTANALHVNVSKSQYVLFSRVKRPNQRIPDDLRIGDVILTRKSDVKFLGIHIDQHLEWGVHINCVKTKIARSTYVLKRIRKQIYTIDAKNLYYTMIYPYLSYAVEVWGAAKKSLLNSIEVAQKRAIHCIVSAHYNI